MSILAIKNIQMRTGHLNLSLWKKIAKILDNYKPIDMVRASLWIFNDWDSDIEESIENVGGIFFFCRRNAK